MMREGFLLNFLKHQIVVKFRTLRLALERVEELAKFADGDRAVLGGCEGRDEGGVGFLFEGDEPDLGAAGAGGLDQEGGVAPLAGNHRKGSAGREVRREEARG